MRILEKELSNKFIYDSVKSKKKKITLSIDNDTIDVDFERIIDTLFTRGNIKDPSLIEDLKKLFNIGLYSNAPCGGFINFYKVKSKKSKNYIIYSGIKEVSNSYFVVEIHKIVKI